jgi:hypothetical protein
VRQHKAGAILPVQVRPRLLLTDPDLPRGRVKGVTSLSGLHDLEPVRLSFVNEKLGLSETDVARLSPIRLQPHATTPRLLLTIGQDEGEEYVRQMNEFAVSWRRSMPHLTATIIPATDHYARDTNQALASGVIVGSFPGRGRSSSAANGPYAIARSTQRCTV